MDFKVTYKDAGRISFTCINKAPFGIRWTTSNFEVLNSAIITMAIEYDITNDDVSLGIYVTPPYYVANEILLFPKKSLTYVDIDLAVQFSRFNYFKKD